MGNLRSECEKLLAVGTREKLVSRKYEMTKHLLVAHVSFCSHFNSELPSDTHSNYWLRKPEIVVLQPSHLKNFSDKFLGRISRLQSFIPAKVGSKLIFENCL